MRQYSGLDVDVKDATENNKQDMTLMSLKQL